MAEYKEEEELRDLEDKVIEEGESYSIVESQEEYLSFSIDGLYEDDKESKFKKSYKLRKDPPKLEISSSNGDKVTFPLSANLTKSMLRVLGDVNYAYLGMKKTKNRFNMGEKQSLLSKIIDIFVSTKLSLIQLFLGMFLGISINRSSAIGVAISLILSLIAIVFHYSKNNNDKENEK